MIIKQELLDPIIAEGLSRSTLKKAYDAVHAYLKYAVYKDFIPKDPMTMLKLPKQSAEIDAESLTEASQSEDEGAVEPLSNEEIKKLYSATSCVWKSTQERKFPLIPAYLFILNTGLRMGEALALHWSDIDWEHKSVSVTKNLILVKNRGVSSGSKHSLIIQATPKSNKSRRTVPLNDDALKYLEELKHLRGTSPDGYIIHSKEGHPIYPRNFQNALDVICKAVGLRKITLHPLRHTYATKLFEAGVDVKIISELLGHSSTEITYRIYIHVIERIKREATSKAFDIMPK